MVLNLGFMVVTLTAWTAVGFAGQVMFFMRWVVQWIFSERVRRSIIPVLFWYFSIFGGIVLLTYAIHIEDPVFILGQTAGLFIYGRNLHFVYRDRRGTEPPPPGSAMPHGPATPQGPGERPWDSRERP